MARGIALQDFVYDVDNGTDSRPADAIVSTMLIRMDKFNIGTTAKKIKKPTTTVPLIPAHVTMSKNKNEFGIHPRYVVAELMLTANSSQCYGTNPKRLVEIPVLTLDQFNQFKVYDKNRGGTQADTTITVNHSQNGSTSLDYRIIKKIPQRVVQSHSILFTLFAITILIMANPTSDQIADINDTDLASAVSAFGLPSVTDARLAIHSIIEHLFDSLKLYADANGELQTYKITKTATNVDLNSQKQTYTFDFLLAIETPAMADEAQL